MVMVFFRSNGQKFGPLVFYLIGPQDSVLGPNLLTSGPFETGKRAINKYFSRLVFRSPMHFEPFFHNAEFDDDFAALQFLF